MSAGWEQWPDTWPEPHTVRLVRDDDRCQHCTHLRVMHGHDHKQHPMCFGNAVCGCSGFREPTPEPTDRRTR